VIGDWGGVFNGVDEPIRPADRRSKHMPSHHRPFVLGADDCAQQNVAKQMEKQSLLSKPDYVLNVGDNFYWGGVLVKCGGPPHSIGDPTGQWTHVYEKMYDGPGLAGKQWLGVLGNHDFGGFLFTHGWDQAIAYTWASHLPMSSGRWLTPALYYRSKVRYSDFSVDYFFIDTNTFDASEPDSDPGHNLCSRMHNLAQGASCGVQGPISVEDCPTWFRNLWNAQVKWLEKSLAQSMAEWQIIVTHFPPIRGWGVEVWKQLSAKYGIDIIISGHVHKQEVHYTDALNSIGPTAYIISGGGGGITSEDLPAATGADDQYGFMDLSLKKEEIMIEAISHGGQLRSRTCVHPRPRDGGPVKVPDGPSMCDRIIVMESPDTLSTPAVTAGMGVESQQQQQQQQFPPQSQGEPFLSAAPPPQLPVSGGLGWGMGVPVASGQASQAVPAADLATMQTPSGMLTQPAAAMQPASPSPAEQLQPQDTFGAVAPAPLAQTVTNSWNSIEVHTALPLVQEFSIPKGVKAPTVRLVKLLHLNGSALTLAAVVVLLVTGLSLSLMRVQRLRSGTCSRSATCGVRAGHNRSSAYAQLHEALQERFETREAHGTEEDAA